MSEEEEARTDNKKNGVAVTDSKDDKIKEKGSNPEGNNDDKKDKNGTKKEASGDI